MSSTSSGPGRRARSDESRPSVPGFDVLRPITAGTTKGLWLVRDSESGELSAFFPRPTESQRRCLLRYSHERLVSLRRSDPGGVTGALLLDVGLGGSVESVCRRAVLSPDEARSVLLDLVDVLEYLHREGTAHGRLSPATVLFDSEGRVLLTDLWESSPGPSGRRAARTTTPLRTPAERTPEADVLALGQVAWFMLTREMPPVEIERPPLTALADVSERFVEVIEASLADEPERRPSLSAWKSVLGKRAAAIPPRLDLEAYPEAGEKLFTQSISRVDIADTSSGTGQGWLRRAVHGDLRRPRRVIIGAAAAGLLLAGGAVALIQTGRQPFQTQNASSQDSSTSSSTHPGSATPTQGESAASSSDADKAKAKDAGKKSPEKKPSPSTSVPRVAVSEAEVSEAVTSLLETRVAALRAGDAKAFTEVSQEGSAARAKDDDLVWRLDPSLRLDGLTADIVVRATVVRPPANPQGKTTATSVVAVSYSAYTAGGKPFQETQELVEVDVVKTADGWKMTDYRVAKG